MASVITNISLKNIKGYGDPATSINLELKTNRINIIYAPNGTGKSSIAAAFKSLNRGNLAPSKEDMHHKDEALLPELLLTMDGQTYSANRTANTISSVLEPYVINCGTVVSTAQQNVGGKYVKVNGYLDIENVVVINNIPPVVEPRYRISAIKEDFGVNGKIFINRAELFKRADFLLICEKVGTQLDLFYKAKSRIQLIDDIKEKIQSLDGKVDYLKQNIRDTWFHSLEDNQIYSQIMNEFKRFTDGLTKLEHFDLFYQISYFWKTSKNDIRKANKRTEYVRQKQRFDDNLSLLDTTWRNIHTIEADNKLWVQFPHANEISNGQRDILTLVVELLKFESTIHEDKKYILIIDEVFDYLDDANTITAQYFLSKFLNLGKNNLFLCMFTHLNPFSFRNYIFCDKKLNFVYLQSTRPVATDAMKAFVAFREGLDKNEAGQNDLYSKMSHDLFHYNPIKVDYSGQIAAYKRNQALCQTWGKTEILHQILIGEVNKYLEGNISYDPYAVAMALRLRVEKIVYDKMEDHLKADYINENMTKNKFKFAEDHDVVVPDVLYVVNAIHNEADHLKYNALNHTYMEKSMVYKLQNKVIQNIIGNIFNWKGIQLTTQVIE